jgi:hypothetical protein
MGHMRKPGCYNQPRPTEESGYFLLTRKYQPDGRYHLEDEWIPFVMSKECKNDFRHPHPECAGCAHHTKEYINGG